MTIRRTRRPAALVAALASVVLLAGCSGGGGKPSPSPIASTSPPSTPTPTQTPTPAPTSKARPAPKPVNPLTGTGSPATGPVIAVKIDDTEPGRPQRNIDQADIVYIEEAEGGLTRLVAVYATHKPVVGYVRSTRPSDPELLLQYGRILLAASGGAPDPLAILARSGLHSWLQQRNAAFYQRVVRQSDYINLILDLAKVAAKARTPSAHSIGWTWAASYPGLAKARAGRSVSTRVGQQAVSFRYDARSKRYVRYIDGVRQVADDGRPVSTPNVIVQTCRVTPHPQDTDINHQPSQFTHTIGRGPLTVLRNGKRIDGTWIRTSVTGGTRLVDRSSHVIPLNPGGAWVALVRTGTPVTS